MLVDTKTYLKAEDIEAVSAMPISIRNCPKPVIAMINGVATGAGLSCALACDFRIVEPSSKMIMAFVNMGLCGDNESIYTLTRLLGPDKAELMMMTGDAYKGEQCVKIGLATVWQKMENWQRPLMHWPQNWLQNHPLPMPARNA